MRIAALSDLHLSTPDGACAFTHTVDAFLAFLDHVEADHDLLLLVGDVFDHDVGPRLGDRRGALRDARLAWAPVVDRLARTRCLQVHGNHDALLEEEGVPATLHLDVDGLRITLQHGHRFNPLGDAIEPIKRPVKWIAARDQRKGGRLGDLLYRVNDLLTQSPPERGRPSATQRGAIEALRRSSTDILICGHDHTPAIVQTPFGIYANSGTCGYGRLDWLSVDTRERAVTLRSGLD